MSAATAPAMIGRVEPRPRTVAREQARDVTATQAYKWLVTRRLDVRQLPLWQRALYVLLVRWLGLPPKPPCVRGLLDTRAEAVRLCASKDDQIQLIPYGWVYGIELDELQGYCRPLDPLFRAQHGRETLLYADPHATPTVAYRDPSLARICDLIRLLEEVSSELRTLLRCLDAGRTKPHD